MINPSTPGKRNPHLSTVLSTRLLDVLYVRQSLAATTPYIHGLELRTRTHDAPLRHEKQSLMAKAIGILRYMVDYASPDLACIAGKLARSVKEVTTRHWRALQQVARFVHETVPHGILYERGNIDVRTASDSYFAGFTAMLQ